MKRIEILIASVVGASVLVMVAIACFFIMYNRKKRDSNEGKHAGHFSILFFRIILIDPRF